MDFEYSHDQFDIRRAVEAVCARYDANYWLSCDVEEQFPEEF